MLKVSKILLAAEGADTYTNEEFEAKYPNQYREVVRVAQLQWGWPDADNAPPEIAPFVAKILEYANHIPYDEPKESLLDIFELPYDPRIDTYILREAYTGICLEAAFNGVYEKYKGKPEESLVDEAIKWITANTKRAVVTPTPKRRPGRPKKTL